MKLGLACATSVESGKARSEAPAERPKAKPKVLRPAGPKFGAVYRVACRFDSARFPPV